MNTGMQDALHLGHKFKRVIVDGEPGAVLDEYQSERFHVARDVLRATHLATAVALREENLFTGWLRRNVVPSLAGVSWIPAMIMKAVSEVAVARRDIETRQGVAPD